MNDNDIITASDLNNIAADLGKTTFANFNDTQTYNIDSLNDITAAIVSKGILSRFDKCACSLIGTALTIKTGIIVFESGAKIRITSNKIINIPDSTNKYYVYAHRDATTGMATIQVQTALPDSGDIVELCEIDGGVLTDKRIQATSKCALTADGVSRKIHVTTQPNTIQTFSVNAENVEKIFFIRTGEDHTESSYGVLDISTLKFDGGHPTYGKPYTHLGWCTGLQEWAMHVNNSGTTQSNGIYITEISKTDDNILTFKVSAAVGSSLDFEFDIYIFGGI